MKKQSVLTFCILFFLSCKTSRVHVDGNQLDKEKEQWVFAFKANAFYECIKHSGIKLEKDASPSLNFQKLGSFKALSITDSLGKVSSKIIDENSVWLKGGDLDGFKAISNGCLVFYDSRALDSIANAEYRRYKDY